MIVYGTEGRDYMAAGQSGMATSTDGDTDITFSPSTFELEVHLLGGDDHFDGRGTGGAGLKFQGPIVVTGGEGDDDLLRGSVGADVIDGGPGDDVLDAQDGDDILRGGAGNDTLGAGGGADSIDGGAGIDTMNGSEGDDTFLAQDDEADATISGGSGLGHGLHRHGRRPGADHGRERVRRRHAAAPTRLRLRLRRSDQGGQGDARAGRHGDARRRR